MRRLGLYLSTTPEMGGAHQYNLAVLSAVTPLSAEGWGLTAFIAAPIWRELVPESFDIVDLRPPAFLLRLASGGWGRLARTPAGSRRAGRLLPPTLTINRSGCDLVLFPAQELEACQLKLPTLVAVHDLMHRYEPQFAEYQGSVFKKRERHYACLSQFAAGILVDSELGKKQLLESYGGDENRIFVLPFVPPRYLSTSVGVDVRAKYGLHNRYLFYPAQFWEHKNHVRLVEAVALAKARGVAARLVLVGAPKDAYDRTVERILSLGLEEDVRIIGYVPNEEMSSFYADAVATVFVSLIGPTNIPPVEAMLVGSPLIVSNRYAMPSQVGEAALLVDPTDVEDIAEKIIRVWRDEQLRRRLVEMGRKRSALWTAEHFALRLRQIITHVVEELGARTPRQSHPSSL